MTAHGTSSTYRAGCRCDECKDYKAAASREYRRSRAGVSQADAEPATFGVPASCLGCGGPLELLASGVPTASRTETRAVLKCRRNGCRREHLLGVTLVSADARELAS